MFFKLTDLALEKNGNNNASSEKICGIDVWSSEYDGARHFTVDVGRVWLMDGEMRSARARAISEILGRLIPCEGSVFVAGLGNRGITADSIGPLVSEKVIVSRHIKKLDPRLYENIGFGDVSAFAPGVLGQTGIESADLIEAAVGRIKPDAVMIVDALAARKLDRLCTTVQISDGGITPGSGVHNRRCRLGSETLGVKTVAIGIPTVVDAATMISDLIEENGGKISEEGMNNIQKAEVYVTLKEMDNVMKEMSRLIADGINLAFHKKIPYEDLNEYRTQ